MAKRNRSGKGPALRDFDCAVCGRPMREVLEAISVSGDGRPVPFWHYGDGTARMICGVCERDGLAFAQRR